MDHQTAEVSFHQPIVPPYFVEDCRTLHYYCNLSLFSLIFAQYLLLSVFYYQIELSCLMFSWSLTHILYFPWFYVTNFAVSLPGLGPEDFRDPKSIRYLKQEIDRLYMMLFCSHYPAANAQWCIFNNSSLLLSNSQISTQSSKL